MSGLLFVASFAVLLGLAQLLGLAHDSRDGHDWHPPRPRHRVPPEPVDNVVPLRHRRSARRRMAA